MSDIVTDLKTFLDTALTSWHAVKEIGNRLGIAENTVKNHLKNILGKLHLANRVQAATFAIEKGLIPKKNLVA